VGDWSGRTLGVCEDPVVHLYHGANVYRRYNERYSLLTGFMPDVHVRRRPDGLAEWSDSIYETAPEMPGAVAGYFWQRREDDT
jgi:hypothetical protein